MLKLPASQQRLLYNTSTPSYLVLQSHRPLRRVNAAFCCTEYSVPVKERLCLCMLCYPVQLCLHTRLFYSIPFMHSACCIAKHVCVFASSLQITGHADDVCPTAALLQMRFVEYIQIAATCTVYSAMQGPRHMLANKTISLKGTPGFSQLPNKYCPVITGKASRRCAQLYPSH